MESVSSAVVVGFLIVGAVVLFFFIVVGLPVWLYHRREVMRMQGLARNETAVLGERVAVLEQRCDKLEEKITEAHVLLADEQRQMDRKLASILPDSPAPPAEPGEEDKRRGEGRRRTR